MKTSDALKMAGIVAAGVVAYLVVTKAAKAGVKAVDAVKEVVTKDLNPASNQNIVYKNLPEKVQTGIGDALGFIFDHANYVKYKAATENGGHSNVQTQKTTAVPISPTVKSTAGAGQSSASFAMTDVRRLDIMPTYVNPLADVQTQDFNAMGDYPFNFGN